MSWDRARFTWGDFAKYARIWESFFDPISFVAGRKTRKFNQHKTWEILLCHSLVQEDPIQSRDPEPLLRMIRWQIPSGRWPMLLLKKSRIVDRWFRQFGSILNSHPHFSICYGSERDCRPHQGCQSYRTLSSDTRPQNSFEHGAESTWSISQKWNWHRRHCTLWGWSIHWLYFRPTSSVILDTSFGILLSRSTK